MTKNPHVRVHELTSRAVLRIAPPPPLPHSASRSSSPSGHDNSSALDKMRTCPWRIKPRLGRLGNGGGDGPSFHRNSFLFVSSSRPLRERLPAFPDPLAAADAELRRSDTSSDSLSPLLPMILPSSLSLLRLSSSLLVRSSSTAATRSAFGMLEGTRCSRFCDFLIDDAAKATK